MPELLNVKNMRSLSYECRCTAIYYPGMLSRFKVHIIIIISAIHPLLILLSLWKHSFRPDTVMNGTVCMIILKPHSFIVSILHCCPTLNSCLYFKTSLGI